MAHELSITRNGSNQAMFAGEKPWDNLGTKVSELKTPMAALEKADMKWKVTLQRIQLVNGLAINDKFATVREDTGAYLGIVGRSYKPVQNEGQARFLDGLTDGSAVVEQVGIIRGGRRTFWTCRIPGDMVVGDGDKVQRYLILANGHDGSMAFRAVWSPIRVICSNALNAALREGSGVCYYHSVNIMNRVDQARGMLGFAEKYYNNLNVKFNALRRVGLDDPTLRTYVDRVFVECCKTPTKQMVERLEKIRGQVRSNFYRGVGADMAGRTAWGAYNACTEFLDHQSWSRRSTRDTRFESILMGSVRDQQQRAFNMACELAEVN